MLTIYKASAGSGKTYTLTRKYLSLLLGTRNPETGKFAINRSAGRNARTILAVTFTNKATEEMKRRIVKELSLLAFSPEKSDHAEYLSALFGNIGIEKLSAAAEAELQALLFAFSDFNISTIDSFFQSILRGFAAELNRPGNFDIELDSRLAVAESADAMLHELSRPDILREKGEVENLSRWLMQYIRLQIEEGGAFNIFNRDGNVFDSVVKIINSLMNEKYSLNSELINSYLEDREKLHSFLKEIHLTLRNSYDALRSRASEFLNAVTAETGSYEMSGCKFSASWMHTCAESGDFTQKLPAAAAAGCENPDALFSKTTKGKKCVPVSESVKSMLVSFIDFYRNNVILAKTLKAIEKRIFYLGILGPVVKVLKSRCISQNSILIQDTTEFLHRIIGQDLSPFVYDKIGTVLNHYLIDEFQDTSTMQWLNFRPLVLDTLASRNENLIIGDEKQCIYRFRNSEPELLGSKVKADVVRTLNDSSAVCEQGLVLSENTNYRSADEIIRFNNTIFASLGFLDRFSSIPAYRNVIQDIPERRAPFHGHIKMQFLSSSRSDDDTDGSGKLKKDDLKDLAVEKAVNEVARMLSRFRPGDIAILTRTNVEASCIMEGLLAAMEPDEEGVSKLPKFNIISGQALQVGIAKSVKMIIDILRIVDSPESRLGADESEDKKKGHFKSDLARLVHHYHIALSNGLSSAEALAKASAPDTPATDPVLEKAINRQSYDLIGVVERVIAELPATDRQRDAVFIAAFQDCVITYMEKGNGDIHSFLEWWDRTGADTPVDSPAGSDSLTISTIHKSKGIEYRCVIIPFAEWKFVEESNAYRRDIRWYDTTPLKATGITCGNIPPLIPMEKTASLTDTLFSREYEAQNAEQRSDKLNITYVAFTRAVEELSIISYKTDTGSEPLHDYLLDAIASSGILSEKLKAEEDRESGSRDSEKKLGLIMNLNDFYDPETGILEIGNMREIPYAEQLEAELKKKLDSMTDEEKRQAEDEKKANAPQLMPPFVSVDRRESLRLCKVEDDDVYDPEKTRLNSKYGLTKLGTDEEFEEENIRVIGSFLHNVLAKTYTIPDLDYALESEADKILLGEDLRHKYHKLLSTAVNSGTAARWFVGIRKVLTERPLAAMVTDRDGNTRLSLPRPDRVVWTEDGYIDVVDFKFGKPRMKEHSAQVANYMRYLSENGEKNIRGFVWYINCDKVFEIDSGSLFDCFPEEVF